MAKIEQLFITQLYRAELSGASAIRLNSELEQSCLLLASEDAAGKRWCLENSYPGYTSYASLTDLDVRLPAFADLIAVLDKHVADFARAADFDLGGRKLVVDSLWANVLNPGGHHAAHIHPQSVVSGTYYVAVPPGASALKIEDPRLGLMMAAPPKRAKAKLGNRGFVYVEPKERTLLLWESWLRHEVPPNKAKGKRISVSFNYRWN
jgi:uncharacterized protein (TIGR02466 family)